jgi:hypothetical protein
VGAGVLLAFVLGGISGYVYAFLSEQSSVERSSNREASCLHRLEEIQANLTCEDLEKIGLAGPRRMGDITFYLDVRDDDYFVIGLASGAPDAPLVSWTGANRQETVRQLCG